MDNFIEISAKEIEFNLINLPQLVFEVTDACNLRCKYCGYGGFYEGYDKRENLKLPFEKAKLIIDYLYKLWSREACSHVMVPIIIGFYGGEPLLNVPFIKQVIEYLESLPIVGKKFLYNMTTNAVLLDQYMDFLAEKEFRLLISLDGNKEGHSYRIDATGENSFDRVFQNIQLLRSKYPDYYKRLVRFNAVLHNRNSVESVFRFIKDNLGKEPDISPLNNSGIRKDQVEEFRKTYCNFEESLKHSPNCEVLKSELFLKDPQTNYLVDYIQTYSGNVHPNYNSLFIDKDTLLYPPTGTCTPFVKKMFVTVKGRILQCERINHEFAFGQITEKEVELDLEETARRFNEYIFKYRKQCQVCALKRACFQCVYQIDDINEENTKCKNYCSFNQLQERQRNVLTYLDTHPELYKRILRNVVVR